MNKKYILAILVAGHFIASSHAQIVVDLEIPCDELIERVDKPYRHSPADTLAPSKCEANSWYPATKVLRYGPDDAYTIIKKQVRVVTETIWDADNCDATTNIISQDTTEVAREFHPMVSGETTGGYWTVRFELRTTAVDRRPEATFATKLANGKFKGYWVYHDGEYDTKAEATTAAAAFRRSHPEFPCAYAYFLPEGCEWQYVYQDESSSE